MSEERKKFEPFKPAEPQIPGVIPAAADSGAQQGKEARSGKRMALGIGLAVVIVCVIVVLAIRTWSKGEPTTADSAPSEAAATPAQPVTAPRASLPVGPGEIASVAEMAKPWAAKEFIFRKPFTNENVPALVVRLPGGNEQSAGAYWAFAKKRPYGNCELEFVTDLNRLAQEFRYRAKHPMVVDGCDGTVYDPLRYGSAAGALVRGEVVAGPGLRPPVAIEVRLKGGMVLADRME